MSEWLPIDSAPQIAWGEAAPECLVYEPGWGIRMGRAWRDPDGKPHSRMTWVNGECECTHWQPLPAPPPDHIDAQAGGIGIK